MWFSRASRCTLLHWQKTKRSTHRRSGRLCEKKCVKCGGFWACFFKYLAGARFITCAFNLKKLQHTLGSVRYRGCLYQKEYYRNFAISSSILFTVNTIGYEKSEVVLISSVIFWKAFTIACLVIPKIVNSFLCSIPIPKKWNETGLAKKTFNSESNCRERLYFFSE